VSNCVLVRNLKGGGQGSMWAVEPLGDDDDDDEFYFFVRV
jgi:hypothetical protein